MLFLEAARIDLHPLYVLDTQKVAQNPLQLAFRCPLHRLLELVDHPLVYPSVFNIADNDATFTLQALLLIVAIDSVNQPSLIQTHKTLLSLFEKIAKAPLPLNANQKELQRIANKPDKATKAKTRLEKKKRKAERKEKRKEEADANAARLEDKSNEHES